MVMAIIIKINDNQDVEGKLVELNPNNNVHICTLCKIWMLYSTRKTVLSLAESCDSIYHQTQAAYVSSYSIIW